MWSSWWQDIDLYFLRARKERRVRREKLGPQELLDPPVHVDPLEMMVPRVTLYVSCTKTHTRIHDWCTIRAASDSVIVSYFSVELSSATAVVDTMSNMWSKLTFFNASMCLQGPVGFPGDPGPPGEPGAAVSAAFIPQSVASCLQYHRIWCICIIIIMAMS